MRMEYIVEDGMVMMVCPDADCGADVGAHGFWVELEEDEVDDHFGGHTVSVLPEDAPCPACGLQGEPVEREVA